MTVPEAISAPENVLLPLKVLLPARIAGSNEVLSRLNVRVVLVALPDKRDSATLVESASSTGLKTASDTSIGWPTASHVLLFQTTEVASPAIHASQPVRGTRRIQTPSVQKATFGCQPARKPVEPEATICRSPSVGPTDGVVRM